MNDPRDAAMAVHPAGMYRMLTRWHAEPFGNEWRIVIVEQTADGPLTTPSSLLVSSDGLAYLDPDRYGYLVTARRRFEHRLIRRYERGLARLKLAARRWGAS